MKTRVQKFIESRLPSVIKKELKDWEEKWPRVTSLSYVEGFSEAIIGRLWDVTLSHFKGYSSSGSFCSAEEAVAEIMRRGLKKESIEAREGKFILHFPNQVYVVKKCGRMFTTCPSGGHLDPMRWINLSKGDFTEFIFAFDECVVSVMELITDALAELMQRLQRQCRVADEVEALSENYLKVAEIDCEVLIFEKDGCPRLQFTKEDVFPMSKKLDPSELEEYFKTVPKLMARRPMDKLKNYFMFEENSGTMTVCLDWRGLPKKDRMDLIDYFIKDDSKTHSRISDMAFDTTEDGLAKIHFCFRHFDWVHLLWDIEQTYPGLHAYYAVVLPYLIYTNDAEGKCFLIDSWRIKTVHDLHEIRPDCDVDKTKDMSQLTWNGLEWCDVFEEDDEKNTIY